MNALSWVHSGHNFHPAGPKLKQNVSYTCSAHRLKVVAQYSRIWPELLPILKSDPKFQNSQETIKHY